MDISRFRSAIREGSIDPWAAGVLWGKSSPSPPPAPDYAGAAQATAAGNVENTRLAAKANRVDQYTPYGNINYTQGVDGDSDRWRLDYNLSPIGQQLLDYQNNAALGLGSQTGQALDRVNQVLSQPFDYGSVADVQNAAQKAVTDRLDPMWDRREQQMQTQLANQGLKLGSEAYSNALKDFNVGRNDAYQQAILTGINTMPQTYQMANALRSQPLNELNALRTGSQVTNPQFQQVPQQQTTPGPNMLAAAQGQYGSQMDAYNAQVGQNNALMSGLFSLGSAALGAPVGTFSSIFSDRRLKSNIERVGTHPLGIGIYEYDIFGNRERGVMADEVMTVKPEAVSTHSSGYMQVDYSALGA